MVLVQLILVGARFPTKKYRKFTIVVTRVVVAVVVASALKNSVKFVVVSVQHAEMRFEKWNTANSHSVDGITIVVDIHIAKLTAKGIASIVDPEAGDTASKGDASHITDSLDAVSSAEKVQSLRVGLEQS